MLLKSSIIFVACIIATNSMFKMNKTDKIIGEIVNKFSHEMAEKDFYIAKWGGGAQDNKINLIKITMDINEIMNIESGRKMILDTSTCLMKTINSNICFKENYIEYPYPLEGICLSILGRTPDVHQEFISAVFLIDGHLYYCTDDPEKEVAPFIDVYDETYDEAKAIVHEQHPD